MIACLRPLIGLSCLRGRGQPPRRGAPGVVHRHAYRLLVAAAAASVALPCVAMAFPAVAGLHCHGRQDSGVARTLFHLHRDAPLPRTDGALATRASVPDRSAGRPRAPVITVAACALLAAAIWLWLARRARGVPVPAALRARQVRTDEPLFRSLIQMTPSGLCLVDIARAQPVVQNELMRRYADAAERCGMDLYAALVEGHARARSRSGPGGDPEIDEFELSHPAIDQIPARHLLVSATRVVHAQRPVLLCVLQDLTARVELQQQKDLLHEQADAAHRARSRLLAAMSHEIRTPLHGILGHLELLSRSRLDSEQQARLRRITQSADSLLLIISDVLDLERVEADQLGLEVVTFEPAVLIEGVALLYAPLAQGKGVDLDLLVDPLLASHYSGPMARIEQVLRNLVGNAIKFTPSGRIEIRLLPSQQPGALRWEVADSGIGLSASQQQNLFEPFIQADASIAGRFGGSGLGLTLCRQLCRVMGGDIDVQSTSGVGSVFGFDIPLLPAERHATAASGPLSGRQVLLHSTVIGWREELARRLRGWGAEVLLLDSLEQMGAQADRGPLPLVVFERNQRAAGPAPHAGAERVVRVRSDGPLRAALQEGAWQVSAYSAASLLQALLDAGSRSDAAQAVDQSMASRAGIG
ncbi:ATP-binding protein [Stenotrophomonas pennii]|uniref:sensor histidine kinase n=1 Tax=Stenotrophomonas lacuserhaii TaxID=2760084 RepID=UPI00320B0B99